MKILNKLTIRGLKLNKKRTIVTMIGIILSVALICAVGGMVSSFRRTLLQDVIDKTGYYHLKISTTRDKLNDLYNNRDIKSMTVVDKIGYSLLPASKNEYKPYLLLYSLDGKEKFGLLPFSLLEGRYPVNSSEVVISKSILTNAKVNLQVGDKLSLKLGKRYACSQEIISGGYIKREKDDEDAFCDREELKVNSLKEVTIVGIIERPNYNFEPYNEAGYTILTVGMEKEVVDAYITLKDPREYQQSIAEILGVKANGYISDDVELKYSNYDINNQLLRWEAFKFSNGTMEMLLSISLVVMVIIVITSVYCIRNSFLISQVEKTKMFGMLSSIGATKKQIKKSVLKEGFYLGIIAIPIGIMGGILADFILIIILNQIGSNFLLGNDKGFIFDMSWLAIIVAVILSMVTIYLSAITSARRASKITPLEAIRNSNEIKIKGRKMACPVWISKLFGTGGVIAYKNLQRSRKKYRTTVISIVVSVLTFISLNSFITYGFKLSGVYYDNYNYDLKISARNQDNFPVDKILALDHIKNHNVIYDTKYSLQVNDLAKLTKFGYETWLMQYEPDQLPNNFALEIIGLNDEDFKKYLKDNHLNYDKYKDQAVLINNYLTHDDKTNKMTERNLLKYEKNDTIAGLVNDQAFKIKIMAVLEDRPLGLENHYYTSGAIVVNTKYYEKLSFYPKSLAIVSDDLDKLTYEIDKLGLDLYINNYKETADNERSMMLICSIFLYGFITVISLIGITNIFNTITANVKLRQRELAIFKSIGMTKREFNRMINLETIFYATKSLGYGICLGLIGSLLIYKAFASNYDAGFIWPIKAIIIACVIVVCLVFVIMRYSINKINKQNTIETIRNENI